MKKLKDPQDSIARFFGKVDELQEKLGPILFQLPPGWHLNLERLENFLNVLPAGYRYTFEFRHESWYAPEVLELLQKYNAAFCIYELEHQLSPLAVTAGFVYVRLHGPGIKYSGNYTESALQEWAQKCREWQLQGKDVYVYFDNDMGGYAAFNALRLQELVQGP